MASENQEPLFFRTAADFRRWLLKNHDKKDSVWLGFYKPVAGVSGLKSKEAVDQALCFGWIFGIIKSVDPLSYKMQFHRRKKNSAWSAGTLKRARELEKAGLLHASGKRALAERDRSSPSEKEPRFTPSQSKAFKANKKAWEFFENQTPSYRKYMQMWVNGAKREETREKRLRMLIEDSASGSKLRRIVEATEKIKKRHPPGATPIEEARNIGPVTGVELRSVGIDTVEKLKSLGWERAFEQLIQMYPHRLNLNMAVGLIAAIEDKDWRKIDPEEKAEARALIRARRREF
jgi:uncharacterized protein YdeI (YjbR/CyaY-like superfamily)